MNTIEDTEPKVTSLVRRVLLQLANGSGPDENLFTTELRAELFPLWPEDIGESLNKLSFRVAIINSSELVERRDGKQLARLIVTS